MTAVMDRLIEDALGIEENVQRFTEDWALALEAKATAHERKRQAEREYQEAELDFLFECRLDVDFYKREKATNAESRKAVDDRWLIKARSNGDLARQWAMLRASEKEYDNAAMAFDQMDARFKAIRVVAELRAAVLNAAAS